VLVPRHYALAQMLGQEWNAGAASAATLEPSVSSTLGRQLDRAAGPMGRGRHDEYLRAAHDWCADGGFLIWLDQTAIDALLERASGWAAKRKAPPERGLGPGPQSSNQ
jgi:hypothetical protein